MKVYIVLGVIPKAFTSAQKAAENTWALYAPIAIVNSFTDRAQFVGEVQRKLRAGETVPAGAFEGSPKIIPLEVIK
jgi:hypothetical protein